MKISTNLPPAMHRRLKAEHLVLLGILILSFGIRVGQIDTALFSPEQAWIAHASWEIATLRDFYSFGYQTSAGYNNFPLIYYLTAIPQFLTDDLYALILFFILLNLLSVCLCWVFTRRYWGWRTAALATVVYACMPWAIIFSSFIWSNTLTPPFTMLWALGCGLAFQEKRTGGLMLAWGAAWLAFQLHISAILLLATLAVMMWRFRLPRAGRYALGGSLLALLPALPWLYAQITGSAIFALDFTISTGGSGFQFHLDKIAQFLGADNLAANFISAGRDDLAAQLSYMHYLAPLWLFLYAGALLFAMRQIGRGSAEQRPLYWLLSLWCVLSLGFTVVSEAKHSIVYYLPLLPAPCILLSLWLQQMVTRRPSLRSPIIAIVLILAALNLNAVLRIDQHIHEGMQKMETSSHALPLVAEHYVPPLAWQMEIAKVIRGHLDAGSASELILLHYILPDQSWLELRWPFPYHLRGYDVRVVNLYEPHIVYPKPASLLLRNETDWSQNGGYTNQLEFLEQVGPYHLYRLAADAAPEPQNPLPARPAYENGLRLLGYDALRCAGSWRLHWTQSILSDVLSQQKSVRTFRYSVEDAFFPVHFFVHLLDAAGDLLLQKDLRAYDVLYWRPGDRVVTSVDFGRDLSDLPIETIRVGLYHYSDGSEAMQGGIYALDEQGRPWLYAIDIPFAQACQP